MVDTPWHVAKRTPEVIEVSLSYNLQLPPSFVTLTNNTPSPTPTPTASPTASPTPAHLLDRSIGIYLPKGAPRLYIYLLQVNNTQSEVQTSSSLDLNLSITWFTESCLAPLSAIPFTTWNCCKGVKLIQGVKRSPHDTSRDAVLMSQVIDNRHRGGGGGHGGCMGRVERSYIFRSTSSVHAMIIHILMQLLYYVP